MKNLNEKIKEFLKTQTIVLPNDEIKKLIFEVLRKNNNHLLTDEQLMAIIKESISKKTSEYLSDEKNLIAVLNRFIEENLKECKSPWAIKEVNKLVNFIESLNVNFSLKIANEINCNSKFSKLFSQVIKQQFFDEEEKKEVWTTLFTSYCLNNNIDLENNLFDFDDIDLCDLTVYMHEIATYPLLTFEEEKILGKKIAQGDKEALNKLIKHNLRLVVFLAKKNLNRGLELEDLISFGNLGLIKAAQMFDSEKNNKFSTYAGWWISSYINMGLYSTANNIRIPNHIMEYKRRYLKVKNQIQLEYGREASLEEIVEKTGYSPKLIKELESLIKTVSYNSKISEEDETELYEILPDNNNDLEEHMIKQSLTAKIHELVFHSNLNEMEKNVIFYRYGFYDGTPWTLENIAHLYQMTRERIRQIEARALKKLRTNPKIKNFLIFAENYSQAETNLRTYIENYSQKKSNHSPKKFTKYSTLYELLGINPQEVSKILTKLFPEEIDLIVKKFGPDFCTLNVNNWTREDSLIFNSYVRPILIRIIKNPNFERKQIPRWIKNQRMQTPVSLNLYSFLAKPKEKIDFMLTKLFPEEIEMLEKRFGSDFLTYNEDCFTTIEEEIFNTMLVPAMKSLLLSNTSIHYLPRWIIEKRQNDQHLARKRKESNL